MQQNQKRMFSRLNEVLKSEGFSWRIVQVENSTTSASPGVESNSKEPWLFESFPTTQGVHLYILKDEQGNPVKEFKYNDKDGNQRTLVADGITNTINVIDFRNLTTIAIANWKATFTSDAQIRQDNLVNAGIRQNGSNYELIGVQANAQIQPGETLTHKVIFTCPLVNGQVPVAHNVKLFSGAIASGPTGFGTGVTRQATPNKFDLSKALRLSLLGMTWQISGKIPDWAKAINPQLKDAFLSDGKSDKATGGRDLSGGYHDAGDCIKVAAASASNCLQLLVAGYFYQTKLKASNNYDLLINLIKYYIDWFDKCTELSSSGDRIKAVWHWVSDNRTDHSIMLPCSIQEQRFYTPQGKFRQCFAIADGKESVGEEPPSLMSAVYSLAYLLFKDTDQELAARALDMAILLRDFAHARRGKYTPHTVYASISYGDEITLANICLYMATRESKYLSEAEKLYFAHINYPGWTWVNDNHTSICTFLLGYLTNKQEYLSRISGWVDSWVKGIAGVRIHGGGSPVRSNSDWGSLPQSFTAFAQAIFAHDHLEQRNQAALDLAYKIVNYSLGDNTKGFSWLIGFGNNYPKNPHHRTSMGYDGGNRVELTGLWAAGEKQSGISSYSDRSDDWVTNELCCSYNTSAILLLSTLI